MAMSLILSPGSASATATTFPSLMKLTEIVFFIPYHSTNSSVCDVLFIVECSAGLFSVFVRATWKGVFDTDSQGSEDSPSGGGGGRSSLASAFLKRSKIPIFNY